MAQGLQVFSAAGVELLGPPTRQGKILGVITSTGSNAPGGTYTDITLSAGEKLFVFAYSLAGYYVVATIDQTVSNRINWITNGAGSKIFYGVY